MTPFNKLRSQRGETLTETLAAILLVALSSALFLVLLTAATRTSAAGDGAIQELDRQLTIVEAADPAHAQTGTVTLTRSGSSPQSLPVTFYGQEGELRAYRPVEGGDTP